MNKILIIGSSRSIVETFSKKFINDDVNFLNFRTVWKNRNIDNYDVIVVSGYHHKIIWKNFNSINDYVLNYSKFIFEISQKTRSLLFISTYIPNKSSFSKVAFFYRAIIKKIVNEKNIKILCFKKIIDSRNRNNLIIKILQIIGIKFTTQTKLINNTKNFYLKDLPNPKFYFLKINRTTIIERFLRLFDFD